MALVSIREYAISKGWEHSTVLRKLESGVISKTALVKVPGRKHPKIDTEIADFDLEVSGDTEKQEAFNALHPKGAAAKGEDPQATAGFQEYRGAKVSTEKLKARKLQLEIQEREGKLLNVEIVKQRVTQLVSETRDAILNIPGKITPVLIAIDDPVEFETRLLQELNEALSSLSRFE